VQVGRRKREKKGKTIKRIKRKDTDEEKKIRKR
jgi:hypothetical protein